MLDDRLTRILESDPYPSFSTAEMTRLHRLIEEAVTAAGVDHLVLFGSQRFGTALAWLTQPIGKM